MRNIFAWQGAFFLPWTQAISREERKMDSELLIEEESSTPEPNEEPRDDIASALANLLYEGDYEALELTMAVVLAYEHDRYSVAL